MLSDRRKYFKGITSGYVYMAFSMIVALWMVPYVLKFLTKPEYGIFAIAIDLLGWLSIANLGVTSAFNSKGGHLLGRKDLNELNVLTNTTFFTQLASSILIVVVGVVVVYNPSLVFGNVDVYENINAVVMLLLIGFFIQYITQPLNALLVADKQVHIDNYLRFGLLALQTFLNVVLLNFGFKLMSLAISSLASNTIVSLITWVRIKKSFPSLKLEIKHFEKEKLGSLLKNGVWFSIGGIAGILIMRMDSFLIGKHISLTLVVSFVINNKLYQIAERVYSQIFNTLRPYFAQAYGRKDIDRLKYYYEQINSFSLVFSTIIGIVVFFFGKSFIAWWAGSDYYLGDEVNLLLCVNFIVQSSVLPNRILLATSLFKVVEHNSFRVIEGLFKMVFALFLVKEFGLKGILISSILSSLIFSNFALNYLAGKLLKTPNTKRAFLNMSILVFWLLNYFDTGVNLVISTVILLFYFYVGRNCFKDLFKKSFHQRIMV